MLSDLWKCYSLHLPKNSLDWIKKKPTKKGFLLYTFNGKSWWQHEYGENISKPLCNNNNNRCVILSVIDLPDFFQFAFSKAWNNWPYSQTWWSPGVAQSHVNSNLPNWISMSGSPSSSEEQACLRRAVLQQPSTRFTFTECLQCLFAWQELLGSFEKLDHNVLSPAVIFLHWTCKCSFFSKKMWFCCFQTQFEDRLLIQWQYDQILMFMLFGEQSHNILNLSDNYLVTSSWNAANTDMHKQLYCCLSFPTAGTCSWQTI